MAELPEVALRTRTEHDLDVLYRISADLDSWEERKNSEPAPLTRAEFDARHAPVVDSESPPKRVEFVIELNGAVVGSTTLSDFDPLARHAAAGISLLPEARGRGVGTAAMRQLVEFGFVRLNLRRIHLEAIASNAGALRSYEKVGFVIEGRRREHAWVRGAYVDIVIMGILRSEQVLHV